MTSAPPVTTHDDQTAGAIGSVDESMCSQSASSSRLGRSCWWHGPSCWRRAAAPSLAQPAALAPSPGAADVRPLPGASVVSIIQPLRSFLDWMPPMSPQSFAPLAGRAGQSWAARLKVPASLARTPEALSTRSAGRSALVSPGEAQSTLVASGSASAARAGTSRTRWVRMLAMPGRSRRATARRAPRLWTAITSGSSTSLVSSSGSRQGRGRVSSASLRG
mmetsp:Transcript_21733/g.64082  ORF Transcript_21733/g.64082 Transcript_21733/m.64082 type:complete len:220 (-) Transcript_21733:524-1183(-)